MELQLELEVAAAEVEDDDDVDDDKAEEEKATGPTKLPFSKEGGQGDCVASSPWEITASPWKPLSSVPVPPPAAAAVDADDDDDEEETGTADEKLPLPPSLPLGALLRERYRSEPKLFIKAPAPALLFRERYKSEPKLFIKTPARPS